MEFRGAVKIMERAFVAGLPGHTLWMHLVAMMLARLPKKWFRRAMFTTKRQLKETCKYYLPRHSVLLLKSGAITLN
ncbi:MAG: hypothetical protein D6687_08380 [Acidobacteria bacterium]|nr:MAG: hypothetical protein D6687_08380 [Acidobacteriota bacterium]